MSPGKLWGTQTLLTGLHRQGTFSRGYLILSHRGSLPFSPQPWNWLSFDADTCRKEAHLDTSDCWGLSYYWAGFPSVLAWFFLKADPKTEMGT